MSFLSLVGKNLVRQRARSGLTALGISLGIITVVALGCITAGFRTSALEFMRSGGADFLVMGADAPDLELSVVAEADRAWLAARDDVARAAGTVMMVARVGATPFFLVFGREPSDLAARPPPLTSGRSLAAEGADEIMLGAHAARLLSARVGDVVTIHQRPLRVVGIYETGRTREDGGAYGSLATVQAMTGKPGAYTGVYVTVGAGADPDAVAAAIEAERPGLTTAGGIEDVGKFDQSLELLAAANFAISILAVGIGAIGVMNTMIMSIFERTREIGILRAVGWGGGRILAMIVCESLVLCLVAAVFGTVVGVLATRGLMLSGAVSSFLQPQYPAEVFARALAVAVTVALAGAAYPAFRAIRLTPLEALRHE